MFAMIARMIAASLIPVESSNLAAVGYDGRSAVLTILFRSGGAYQYYAVPPGVYDQLMASASLGSFFAARIRPIYPCCRIA